MRLRARWAPAALLLIVPLIGTTPATADTGRTLVQVQKSAQAVPGQYIVTLTSEMQLDKTAEKLGVNTLFTYRKVLHGFAAALTPAQLETVRGTAGVQEVEENSVASAPSPAAVPPPAAGLSAGSRVAAASWGLDRIDQRSLPLDGAYNPSGTGSGVTAYIVDTGIDAAHTEFGGRVADGFDSIGDGRNGQDCNGHGTHVAGTVGGATYGVARSTALVPVRVLDCDGTGSWAGIIAGLDWIAENAELPAVVNASLGGPSSSAVDAAFNSLSDQGIPPVVAAGNENQDACDVSPAGAGGALAVGASDNQDRQTDFSNWGKCVWMYAPGAAIVSAGLGGGSAALSGTSMASPHVAGVVALYQEQNPSATTQDIADWLADESTAGVLSNLGTGSPDRLLHTAGL